MLLLSEDVDSIMAQLQDLDDYKIETTFQKNPDCVIHTLYRANWARGTHKEAVTETWSSQDEIIGSGTFGTVHLQRRLDGKDDIRAVKQLWKSQMTRLNIDYRKELLALTKFSRSKVSDKLPPAEKICLKLFIV